MLIHSLSILVSHKQYVNLPVAYMDTIRDLFGPSIASAWEVIYTESRATHGTIKRTYAYLARKVGVSRRTIIRYVKYMVEAGILIIHHRFNHKSNLCNEFTLLSIEEARVATGLSKDRAKPDINIDYSVDYLVENQNSVDKSVSFCHPSILDLNHDINNKETEPKTAIIACRQEEKEENRIHIPDKYLPNGQNSIQPVTKCNHLEYSVPDYAVREVERHIIAMDGISSPSELVQEAIYFIANRKPTYSVWKAIGAFAKLVKNNAWTTPFGMRKK